MCTIVCSTDGLPTSPTDGSFVPQDTSDLQSFHGYGDVGFQAGGHLPPPPPAEEERGPPPKMTFDTYVSMVFKYSQVGLVLVKFWEFSH